MTQPDIDPPSRHTDLMVAPETLDKFMEDNPLPSEPDADGLQRCPFCDGNGSIICCGPNKEEIANAIAWGQDYDVAYYGECDSCKATSQVAAEKAEAIAAWNRRAAPVGWQPIATAPKDGTTILVCHRLQAKDAPWHPDEIWPDKWGAINDTEEGWQFAAEESSHWQPLPEPPR